MTEDPGVPGAPGTYVGQAYGPLGTGAPQYNQIQQTHHHYYYAAAASRLQSRAATPRGISAGDLAHLAQRFVAPPGYQRALAVLRDHGSVLLGGRPGSGRRTTALMLLHELCRGAGVFQELPDTCDDDAPALDASMVDPGAQLLLDLSNSDDPAHYEAVQDELSSFREAVSRRSARLVIVLPDRFDYLLRPGLHHLREPVSRPDGHTLLARRLRLDGLLTEHPLPPEVTEYAADAPVSALVQLADRIRQGRTQNPDGSFAQWCARALAEVGDRSPEAAALVSRTAEGRGRALLLALAMLPGSTPATIHHSATALLKMIGHPADGAPVLARTDLVEEFHTVEAATDADGRVAFRATGMATAVRNHFWTYWPDLHPKFRDWAAERVSSQSLSQDERGTLVRHLAEQCLRTDRPEDLAWLAEHWAGRARPERLLPDTAQVLSEGLRDRRHGRWFRRWVYSHSVDGELPGPLRRALVLVCAEVMADSHPDQALVRLHHLARNEGASADRPALTALLGLVRGDRRLFRLLLARLAPGDHPGDAAVFYALIPSVTAGRPSPAVLEHVRNLWAGVLEHRPREEWTVPLLRWMDAPDTTALDVLAEAAVRHRGALGPLYQATGRRGDAATRLWQKIDAAQGV